MEVTFVDHLGEQRTVSVRDGCNVMEAARNGDVPGIEGACGGLCACATCHVYVDPAWSNVVGPPGNTEAAMLEFASETASNSRLACQIRMSNELDGLVIRTPKSQH